MDREVIKAGVMVGVVAALLVLTIVTPGLMGRPTVLSAIPALIIGITESRVVVDLHGAVDHYLYKSISLTLHGEDNASFRLDAADYETYDLEVNFSRTATRAFDLSVVIADRQGTTFALNGTVFQGKDGSGDFVSMTDRGTYRTVLVRPPADFRALVPRGEPG